MARVYSVGSKAEEAAMAREFMKRKTPTVQEVRQESRTRKAEAVVKPATAKRQAIQGKPGESQMSSAEAGRRSSAPVSSGPRRGGGVTVPKKAAPSNKVTYTGDAPGSSAEAYRARDPKARLKAQTAETRSQIEAALPFVSGASKVAARIGQGLVRRYGTRLAQVREKMFPTMPKTRIEAPRKLLPAPKPQAQPKPASVSKNVMPKRSNVKVDRTPGTYTAETKPRLTPRQKAARKGAKTKKNVKQFFRETGVNPRSGGSWEF